MTVTVGRVAAMIIAARHVDTSAASSGQIRRTVMRIKPIFAWYDLWVGAFWDSRKRRLYILPLPCVGIVIQFQENADAGNAS